MVDSIIFGGGCFWCIEAMFQDVPGILKVESGYCGGHTPDPTYKQVCGGTTGHAEVVRIEFDPLVLNRADLLRLFFVAHDPTQLNMQGGDIGTQYRSVIFYRDEENLQEVNAVIKELSPLFEGRIVTSLEPESPFYPAEAEHHDYFNRFESASLWDKLNFNAPYCQAVVAPKVAKFRKMVKERLREKA